MPTAIKSTRDLHTWKRISQLSLLSGILALALVLVVLSRGAWHSENIAFVRSGALLDRFAGMEDARKRLKAKEETWKENVAVLEGELTDLVTKLKAEFQRLSKAEMEAREKEVELRRDQYLQYVKTMREQAASEESRLMEGVVERINEFTATYGREHGYDLILATTADGSILYGEDAIDITDPLLAALNAAYTGAEDTYEN